MAIYSSFTQLKIVIFHTYVSLPDGIDLCQGFLILWLTVA